MSPEDSARLNQVGDELPAPRPGGTRPVVLHVTESYGGGVLVAIQDYMRNSPDVEHHLAYSPRADSAMSERDLDGFASVTELPEGHLQRTRFLRTLIKSFDVSIIHAHSSFGGAYARLAVRSTSARPIVYTPHCFGFERTDLSKLARSAYWLIEFVLSINTSVVAACSKRELRLSRFPMLARRRMMLPNVPPRGLEAELHSSPHSPLRLVGAGRFSVQKDPRFFIDCVLALRAAGHDVEASWIGGGTPKENSTFAENGISATGWLPRSEVLKALRNADAYLHTALWEGFPIAVLESAALGIPTIVRAVPAFDDVPLPLSVGTPADLVALWPRLSAPEDRRGFVTQTSKALAEYNDTAQKHILAKLYGVRSMADRTEE
jgi:glycosyltransferase involved in cell wall biosynthesis